MKEHLYHHFEAFVNAYHMIDKEDDIVVGVSGGADSVCLLSLLQRYQQAYGCGLYAVHVNHMIRGAAADRDELFTKELCSRLNIPFYSEKVDVPKLAQQTGQSEEEAGRQARYEVLCRTAREKSGKIAVAHHMDDNAETVLLNLIRGTGIRGLSGMQPVSERDGCVILRPLLTERREDIEAYLNEDGLSYCTDATNLDEGYSRNALRLRVIPEFLRINSRAVPHIAESAQALWEIEQFLEMEANRRMPKVVSFTPQGAAVRISAWKALEEPLKGRILHKTMAAVAGSSKDLSAVHVRTLADLMQMQSGKKADLPYGLEAVRQYDEILLRKHREPKETAAELAVRKEDLTSSAVVLETPEGVRVCFQVVAVDETNRRKLIQKNRYTKAFDYDRILNVIMVGGKVPGDAIFLQNGRKTVKKFFIDEKIPADQRENILLLKDESSVLWIVGYRISEKHKITRETKKAVLITIDGGNYE